MTESRIASRTINENPIFAISDRAAALRASGIDVITLAAGEPEAATGEDILAAAEAAVRDPRTHHYANADGLPELREAVAARYLRPTIDPAGVQVAVGTKHALHLALRAVTVRPRTHRAPFVAWPRSERCIGRRSVDRGRRRRRRSRRNRGA